MYRQTVLAATWGAACVLLLCGTAWADVEAGRKAYEALDYAAALAEFRPAAESGDAEAAYHLGLMYERGQGIGKSAATAAHWYAKAAANAEACYRLGRLHERGEGVPLSPRDALSWYRKGVGKNHPASMVAAAEMYLAGRGVKTDLMEAQRLLTMAAELGDAQAATRLNMLIGQGRVPRPQAPGEAEPTDPAAQKILADVRAVLAPLSSGAFGGRLTLDGPPRIAPAGEDRFDVYLPGVLLTADDGAATRVGTIRLGLSPARDGRYEDVSVLLPGAIALSTPKEADTILRLGRQDVRLTWDMALGTATAMAAAYEDLSLAPAVGEPLMRLNKLAVDVGTQEPRPGVLDGTETITLSGLRLGLPGNETRIDRVAMKNAFSAFDTIAYLRLLKEIGIDWSSGAAGNGLAALSARFGDLLGLMDGFSSTIDVGGVEVRSGDVAVGRLSDATIALDGKGFGDELAEMRLRLGFNGLAMGDDRQAVAPGIAAPVPERLGVTLAIRNLPVKAMAEQSDRLLAEVLIAALSAAPPPSGPEGSMPMPVAPFAAANTLAGVLRTSGLVLVVEEGTLAGPGYDVTASGELRAEIIGGRFVPLGEIVAEARGLDGLATALESYRAGRTAQGGGEADLGDPARTIAALRARGEPITDAQGRAALRYLVRFARDGVTINGTPWRDATGN